MSIKISLKKNINDKLIKNYVLFSNQKYKINGLSKISLSKNAAEINENIGSNFDNKKKFLLFNIRPNQKIIIIKTDNNQSSLKNEKIGAELYNFIKSNFIYDITFLESNILETNSKNKFFFDEFIHGFQLKSYSFEKYKTKKSNKDLYLNISLSKNYLNLKKDKRFESLIEGTNFTKDLVSEPGNILHPDEYAKRISLLKKFGLKVTIYDKNKLKKLGMNALLGVGQGSIRGSYLVTIEWNGSQSKKKPLAFVGKGVCFDTGGISLKPAKFMEDMTYDMAGSAVVVGLMKNLAIRKAKINAVGVVGLVENMPGGNAQRPGDIIKSFSGKTIEVLNTDAEGRLVLADAITFTEKNFLQNLLLI